MVTTDGDQQLAPLSDLKPRDSPGELIHTATKEKRVSRSSASFGFLFSLEETSWLLWCCYLNALNSDDCLCSYGRFFTKN